MPVAKTGSKDLDELVARFKRGFTLEKTARHYRVRDPQGQLVQSGGKNLTLPSTPGRGRALANMTTELKNAGVLKATQNGAGPRRTPAQIEAQEKRIAKLRGTLSERGKKRQAEANELFERLEKPLSHVGGILSEGMASDMAFVAAMIARQKGLREMTPDLTASSIHRVVRKEWVDARYQELWNDLAERLEKADNLIDAWFELVREARGLPSEVIEIGKPVEGDWPFRVELLAIEAFTVDHDYQRPVPWPFVRKLAASFDESLVGTIDVSERRHGAVFAILDGQLRYEACRLVGKKTVWASIYEGLDKQSEARFFLHKNQDRKAIHPYYTYKAKLTAGDSDTAKITKIVESFGYKVSITSAANDERNISAIAALESAFKRQRPDVAQDCLTPTLRLTKAATFGRKNGQATTLIRGLGRFFEKYRDDEIDMPRLISVIEGRSPDWLIGRAREIRDRTSTDSQETNLVRVLVDEYNRGLRGSGERLRTPDFGRGRWT